MSHRHAIPDPDPLHATYYYAGQRWPDPGPLPAIVEPETDHKVTTIPVTPQMCIEITEDIGRTGCTGLTVHAATGECITLPMPPAAVDALIYALWWSTPVPDLPAGR